MNDFLKVTYYDDDYEKYKTIFAKEVRQIKSCGFPYFEIITNNNDSVVIVPLELKCIKCEINKGGKRCR